MVDLNISGLIPILATPFTSDGDVDYPSLRRLVAFELKCGVDGLGVLGYASEAFSLDEQERVSIIAAVADESDRCVPLVVGIGGSDGLPPTEQAELAAAAGADMLMVMPPPKAVAQDVADFYRATAAASRLPVMIQDAPQLTGTSISSELLDCLCEIPGIRAIKIEAQPTPVRVADAVAVAAGRISVFGGQNALFVLEELDRGAVGTMPACEFSDGLRRVLDLHLSGIAAEARAAFNLLLPLIRYGLQPGLAWAIHKEVLRLGGVIDTAVVRPPALPLDEATASGLRAILADLAGLELAVLEKVVL